MERIPVAGPWITQRELDYVADAAANGWYGNAGVWPERFERAFAEHLGVPYTLALPSCTSALHLSLLALGIGPGDEVIVPEITWIASVAPVTYVGATPVFADVDPRTWCLTPEAVEACLTPRTRALVPVDLYGAMPDMDGLRALAERYRLAIVEDAAAGVGAEFRGRKAGTFGDTGAFSFHGSKTLTTGEGGLLATAREDVYRRCLVLRDHGRTPGDTMFRNVEIGWKYRMTALQAALGLAQLERVEELTARKREIFAWYAEALADRSDLTLDHEPPGTRHAHWMVTVLLDPALDLTKDDVIPRLRARGVDCRPLFDPLSSLPAFAGWPGAGAARRRNRVAYDVAPRGLNLPSGFNLTRETVGRVCDALRAALAS